MRHFGIFALIMAALKMKARPYKLDVYPLKTDEVHVCSRALFGAIIFVTLLFSGWLFDDPLATYSDGACESRDNQVRRYLGDMRNFTGYYDSIRLYKLANLTMLSLYEREESNSKRWNCEGYGGSCNWPHAFEGECRNVVTRIEPVCNRVCALTIFVCVKWISACSPAKTVVVNPCKDREPAFVEPPKQQTRNESYVPEAVNNVVAEAITKVVSRAKTASSIYCFWVAAMIFIGPAYQLCSQSIKGRVQNLLVVNKLIFTALVLAVWYIVESVNTYIIENPRAIKLGLLVEKDPCFIDTDFLRELSDLYSEMCEEIEDNRVHFEHIGQVIDHYARIEHTWVAAGRQPGGAVYNYVPANWTSGCNNDQEVLDALSVPETRSNGLFYLVNSGYIGSIFLQALLVNFIWYIAEFYKPLTAYDGRVIAIRKPTDQTHSSAGFFDPTETDRNRFDGLIRAQHIMGFVFNLAFLLLVLVNLLFPETLDFAGTGT